MRTTAAPAWAAEGATRVSPSDNERASVRIRGEVRMRGLYGTQPAATEGWNPKLVCSKSTWVALLVGGRHIKGAGG